MKGIIRRQPGPKVQTLEKIKGGKMRIVVINNPIIANK